MSAKIYDYVIVGSGINALVAGALLGQAGKRVCLLERNDRPGGCLRSEQMIAPGYIHDIMATTMVLFLTSPAFAKLGAALEKHGVEFAHTQLPTGVLRPDGSHVLVSTERARNIAAFEDVWAGAGVTFDVDMQAFAADAPFIFGLLGGQIWSLKTGWAILREAKKRGLAGLVARLGEVLTPARHYLEAHYESELMQALWAPWGLHCGLNPEAAYSAEMIRVICFAIEAAGCPIIKGGAERLVDGFAGLIAEQGGDIRTGADVDRVLLAASGRAHGVALMDGAQIYAKSGVIASVTPQQLYQRLLREVPMKQEVATGLKNYRYGKGNMQMHYALSAPPRWRAGAALADVALLHLTPSLDAVSRACNAAERGLLPAVPTICVGQPTRLDPSRAPDGGAVLWLQLPEVPRYLKGDEAGLIEVPQDGKWTDAVKEAFADRVEAILATQIEDFRTLVVGRKSYSPADLEALNINLVGGDPYGGYCGLDQFFLWRPFKRPRNHTTSVAGLYHIGASTHPGPGLSGGSGYLLASSLLE